MDWSQSISGGISGGLGLIGSGLNYLFQSKLMDRQNQYNLDMWKLQNEYNSPASQMRRYQEAGLNPALMYGQVTPGNATNAPHLGTPEAPKLSRDMAELGKLFNIEGLKQAIADTKLKQANAKNASVDAERNRQAFEGEKQFGLDYIFDPQSGRFIPAPELDEVNAIAYPYARYIKMKTLSDNFRTNSLLVPRRGLIDSNTNLNKQRSKLIHEQKLNYMWRNRMYAPQLRMLDYQAKHYPTSFWIGTAARGAQAVSPFLPIIF